MQNVPPMVTNNVEWMCSLNPEHRPRAHWRRSSIICTIGPKTNNPDMMNKLRSAGMNVVRMNFSHGEYNYHQSVIDNARKAESIQEGRPLAIALDTKGPEIRTGQTADDADLAIEAGKEIVITCDDAYKQKCTTDIMYVDYKNICKVISEGKIIFVDDGVLSFQVLEVVDQQTLKCKCLNNGKISSRKGVNLPGTDVDLPALSEKDKSDLQFGVKNNVDMVFASFIRRADDIKEIRKCLGEAGKEIRIIAKIENRQGVNNFDEILEQTDGVMVARGDLGIEIPAPEVVLCQKMIIAKCNLAGKPVICATQMLESMTVNPRPTRAEISDIANAVLDGADCVMLSGETAKGAYPIESVRMMHETTIMAETAIAPRITEDIRNLTLRPTATTETVCCSAVAAAYEQNASAIIVLSTSGETARYVAKYRPQVPIIMVTRNETTARNGHLHRGVWPFVYRKSKPSSGEEWQEGVDERLAFGFECAKQLGILNRGEIVVAIQGWRGGLGNSNTLRVLQSP